MTFDGSREDTGVRPAAGRPGRCGCRTTYRRRARALRDRSGRVLLRGLVHLGLCISGGVRTDTGEAALRWCDGLGDPVPPCCTGALPAAFRPTGGPGA